MKILLVDDSPLILKVAELFLRGKHEVLTAASGNEAMNIAIREHPSLILMDYHMPGWSGCETRDALAKDGRTEDIPVVIMTTECQPDKLGKGVDHLVKPFNACQLEAKVGQYQPLFFEPRRASAMVNAGFAKEIDAPNKKAVVTKAPTATAPLWGRGLAPEAAPIRWTA